MPTYVYRFVDTGETIEVQQSFDEPTLTEAPHPGDGQPRPVKKVFTPVGITFKGNGFYKTDSRSSSDGDKSEPATAASKPAPASDTGHSHGPGGHSHGSEPSSDAVESAAAS